MIKYIKHIINLNHKLIETDFLKNDKEYLSFKCTKCNSTIFYTLDQPNEEEKSLWWMYNNGAEIIPNELKPDHPWHFLELTCEEQVIKKLLE